MSDAVSHIARALIGQGETPDHRPFVEWRNRPIRFTPIDTQNVFNMDGKQEFAIVDTQQNSLTGVVYLPPLSAVDDGVRFSVLNLDKLGQGVQQVTVRARPGEPINERDQDILILSPNECRQFVAFRYEWNPQTQGPLYRSWYCCLPGRDIPPPPP